jgi:hypothetical protein
MKETGILMTPENHRAILNKTKWQTRRVINPQPQPPGVLTIGDGNWRVLLKNGMTKVFDWQRDCPHGQVGDKLYIKEGIIIDDAFDSPELAGYYMDGARATLPNQKRLTAMFMAKKYARTWLELTDVKVERLQDISEEDSIAEGITRNGDRYDSHVDGYSGWGSAKEAYKELWDSINQKKHPWSSNPWCWVLEFCVI